MASPEYTLLAAVKVGVTPPRSKHVGPGSFDILLVERMFKQLTSLNEARLSSIRKHDASPEERTEGLAAQMVVYWVRLSWSGSVLITPVTSHFSLQGRYKILE